LVATDAPQPTDDGLAVVAEIGGDFSVQTNNGDAEEGGRANGSRRRRSRRGRRGERFGAPSAEGANEELNAAEEFEGEAALADVEPPPTEEGDAEPFVAQPELPWHLPLDPQTESEAEPIDELVPTTEPVVAEGPSAESPDVEASAAETPAEDEPAPASVAFEVSSDVSEAETASEPEEPASVEPVEPAAPVVEEPPRPRRSGWWQRAAKAIVSE
jgi:ribonuclease E